MIFMGLAGLPDDSHPLALGIVLCMGFLVPFGFLKHQQRQQRYPSAPP